MKNSITRSITETYSDAFLNNWRKCRTEPRIILSNGLILNLTVEIEATSITVDRIEHLLHIPRGTSSAWSISTSPWSAFIETFSLYSDGATDEYQLTTIINTRSGNAGMNVRMALAAATGPELYAISVPGNERTPLKISFNLRSPDLPRYS